MAKHVIRDCRTSTNVMFIHFYLNILWVSLVSHSIPLTVDHHPIIVMVVHHRERSAFRWIAALKCYIWIEITNGKTFFFVYKGIWMYLWSMHTSVLSSIVYRPVEAALSTSEFGKLSGIKKKGKISSVEQKHSTPSIWEEINIPTWIWHV